MDQSHTEMENDVIVDGRSTQILLADHLTLVRESLRHAVYHSTDDMELIECESFDEVASIIQRRADISIVILALRLPGMNGLEGIKKILDYDTGFPVAIISAFYQYADIVGAFKCGAKGFLSKEMESSEIISAIRYIISGNRFVPSEVVESFDGIRKQIKNATDIGMMDELTDREMEVLNLLIEGNSNKSIARALGLEEITIKVHIGKILRKLHAENRTQAALIAFQSRCKDCPSLSFWEDRFLSCEL